MIYYITLLFYQYASLSFKKRLCNIICRVIVVHVCYRSTPDSSCHSAGVTFSLRILVAGEKCNFTGDYCEKGSMCE